MSYNFEGNDAGATKIVQQSWVELQPSVPKLPLLFYTKFWEIAPETKPLFAGKAIRVQGEKLIKLLEMVVKGLDELKNMQSTLDMLAKKHVASGVREAMFAPLGEALYITLGTLLGDKFTPEVKAAWTHLYTHLAEVIKKGLVEEYHRQGKSPVAVVEKPKEAGFWSKFSLCKA
eukprot:CAMPEP_0196570366 /NCGR_PEP_ID=MMETSP1081-20130531/435_1 /TAXON_ID=36882 /ORGANISM="Pyramimonas amylifera, Strain CCMP720" /LENGTH=173 /DNA_ID=CAMNT_0041886765 /DNA_START=134 /DNA_END=655 /DNA_ORIENTATION=+